MAKILIVDDEYHAGHADVLAYRQMLQIHDLTIETNPKRVQAIIEDLQPDLIILDQSMPEISGCTIAEWKLKNYPAIPIIFTTGNTSREHERDAFAQYRALDYVAKPIKPAIMELIIKRTLEGKRYNGCHSIAVIEAYSHAELEMTGVEIYRYSSEMVDMNSVLSRQPGVVIVQAGLSNEELLYEMLRGRADCPYLLSLQPNKKKLGRLRPIKMILDSLNFGAHGYVKLPIVKDVFEARMKSILFPPETIIL